mmetsp:Transcript_19270/g.48231  ORF Transcript_19270/g.48231 Transcript_19270/m.48231 type:complete len:400 (-) Transcript_19270:1310-2509(-)
MSLSLRVELHATGEEFAHDLLGGLVLLDVSVLIEQHHVCARNAGRQLQLLVDVLIILQRRNEIIPSRNRKIDRHFRRLVPVVLDKRRLRPRVPNGRRVQPLLERTGPAAHGEFSDADRLRVVIDTANLTVDIVGLASDNLLDAPLEPAIPGSHWRGLGTLHHHLKVRNDVFGVVRGHGSRPARTDSIRAIHKNHGNNGAVPARLNRHPVLLLVVEKSIVRGWVQNSSNCRQIREDVPRRSGVFSSLQPSTELAARDQQIDVVGPDKVLSQPDNRSHQRHFSVVVRRVLRNVACELRHFHLRLELPLEAAEEHLPLTGLEAVHDAGNGALVVGHGEENELLVDEVGIRQLVAHVVEVRARNKVGEPVLSVADLGLGERHRDQSRVFIPGPLEFDQVLVQV